MIKSSRAAKGEANRAVWRPKCKAHSGCNIRECAGGGKFCNQEEAPVAVMRVHTVAEKRPKRTDLPCKKCLRRAVLVCPPQGKVAGMRAPSLGLKIQARRGLYCVKKRSAWLVMIVHHKRKVPFFKTPSNGEGERG